MSWSIIGWAQDNSSDEDSKIHPFIGYELGEAAFNSFQSISGEVGIRFQNNHLLRLTHMNVSLTEKHLSSSFAGAVDGADVEGRLFGFEAFYDFPVLSKSLYIAPSIGYYKNSYEHTILDEELKTNSATLGVGISYREMNLFNIRGLYYAVSIPMRISLNPIQETMLGETIIKNNTFENNIWLFIGYEF